MNSTISADDIHLHTQAININYEIGGKFKVDKDGSLVFYQSSTGNGPRNNGKRIYVNLPTSGNIWHTHPRKAGFWPSFEDINRHNPLHILFTKYGIWIFKNNPVKDDRTQTEHLKSIYKEFHNSLLIITQRQGGWDVQSVQSIIKTFIKDLKRYFNFYMKFIPNFGPNIPVILLKQTNLI